MGQKVVNVCLERIHRRLMKRRGESRVRAWTGYLWLEVDQRRQERVVVHIWREGRGGGGFKTRGGVSPQKDTRSAMF